MAATIAPFVDRKPEVEARLRQAPNQGVSRWTLKRIGEAFEWLQGYSLSGVWRIMQRLEIGWRWSSPGQFSPDAAYAQKYAHLLACLHIAAQQPSQTVLVFIDEMGFFRWPQGGLNWMPTAPVPAQQLPCAANNRQWRLIGALNALSGQVNYLDNYIVGRRQVGELYQLIDSAYSTAQHVFVVQDNWSIHTHPDVLAVLATLPRLEIVPLPTYAHWLNPIEKLWRWLRQDVLRLHQFAADWPVLLAHVHAFLDQFAAGSQALLRYVGLLGDGKLAAALRSP
jgi:hypothetical protein